MFCIYLRTNSNLCHLQHKLIGFYNCGGKCLQRGTVWFHFQSILVLVFKRLNRKYLKPEILRNKKQEDDSHKNFTARIAVRLNQLDIQDLRVKVISLYSSRVYCTVTQIAAETCALHVLCTRNSALYLFDSTAEKCVTHLTVACIWDNKLLSKRAS
jgi:hypothetical protein